MRAPTIHRNGTSQEALRDQNESARRAIVAAVDALADAAPNARDYYTQGDGAYREAEREHVARLEKLASVLDELNQIAEAIEDGGAS